MPTVQIGEVGFLVKFDSLNKNFDKALKKALKEVSFDVEGIDLEAIKKELFDIKYNLQQRIRSPLSHDYKQFMETQYRQWAKWAKSEKLREQLGAQIEQSPTGKKMLSDDESGREMADKMMDAFVKMMDVSAVKGKVHRKLPQIGSLLEGGVLKGDMESLLKNIFGLLIGEIENISKPLKTLLNTFEGVKTEEKERVWSIIPRKDPEEGMDVIRSQEELFEKIQEILGGMTEEEFLRLYTGPPKEGLTERLEDMAKELFAYGFEPKPGSKGFEIPKKIVNVWRKSEDMINDVIKWVKGLSELTDEIKEVSTTKGGKEVLDELFGRRKYDIFATVIGEGEEFIEEFFEKLSDVFPEEKTERMRERLGGWLEEYGYGFFVGAIKSLMDEDKKRSDEIKTNVEDLLLHIGGTGEAEGQVITKTEFIQNVEELLSDQDKENKQIEARQKNTIDLLKQTINLVKNDTKVSESTKQDLEDKLEELKESLGSQELGE